MPCWQEAGVSKSTMEQYREVERDAHSQVEAARNDTSVAPRQRQIQAREIRQRATQKIGELMTPEQQAKLRACQRERSGNASPGMSH